MTDLQTEGAVTQILSKPNVAEMLQENNLKQFAPVQKSLFFSTTADTSAVVQQLEDANDYVSIQQIVNGDYSLENTIFKIKRHESIDEDSSQNLLL